MVIDNVKYPNSEGARYFDLIPIVNASQEEMSAVTLLSKLSEGDTVETLFFNLDGELVHARDSLSMFAPAMDEAKYFLEVAVQPYGDIEETAN